MANVGAAYKRIIDLEPSVAIIDSDKFAMSQGADLDNEKGVTLLEFNQFLIDSGFVTDDGSFIQGSITATEVAFGSGINAIVGDSSFTFASNNLTIPGQLVTPGNVAISSTLPTSQGLDSIAIGTSSGLTTQGVTAVAIGSFAGNSLQGTNAVAIGTNAGTTGQSSTAIAIGQLAGNSMQGLRSVAIGGSCGSINQSGDAVALGFACGNEDQGSLGIAIGNTCGTTRQGSGAIAIGSLAGVTDQGANGIIISTKAGLSENTTPGHIVLESTTSSLIFDGTRWTFASGDIRIFGDIKTNNNFYIGPSAITSQGTDSVAIGKQAGITTQGQFSVALGTNAGRTTQGGSSVAIGNLAAQSSQGSGGIAIGSQAGQNTQGSNSIAIGENAGVLNQGANGIILSATGFTENNTTAGHIVIKSSTSSLIHDGTDWAFASGDLTIPAQLFPPNSIIINPIKVNSPGTNVVSIGVNAGNATQGNSCVAIGDNTGATRQGDNCVAIGVFAGLTDQFKDCVAIGRSAGETDQSENGIAIGDFAGRTRQGVDGTAIGRAAALSDQGVGAIAIGIDSGSTDQGTQAIAIGGKSGVTNQGQAAVAIGNLAGNISQEDFAVAVGFEAGKSSQGSNAVALGREAGDANQGASSIAIGNSAGRSNQGANGIIISSTGVLNTNTSTGHIVIESNFASLKFANTTDWVFSGGAVTFSETINIEGGLQQKITTVTGATLTIVKNDFMIFADTTIQDITLTLPAIVAGAADDGRIFRVQKIFDVANSLTITPQAPSVINGETTDTIVGIRNDNLSYMASGGDWFIINRDTNAFGSIELTTPGATQGLTLTAAKLAIFDTNRFTTPGVATADQANDRVIVDHIESISQGGDGYALSFRVEVSSFSNNQEILCEIFVNGVGTNIQDVRSVSVGFNTVLEAEGLFQVSGAPQDVEIRILATTVATATFETGQLIIQRITK